jgi:hypothetical protein
MIDWAEQDADMAGSHRALVRAARNAYRTALSHGLPIAIWQDNRVVEIPPEQIRESLNLWRDWSSPLDRPWW